MNRAENSDSIPMDLILEILSRLPAKSIGRFRCMSKLWCSMLSRPYFSDFFLTMSSARPRLLFAVIQNGEWLFYSSPQPQNPYGSLVVAADSHMKLSGGCQYSFSYVSGLTYLRNMRMPKENKDAEHVICNLITGADRADRASTSFLGFDPIDKEFKLLYMNTTFHYILTLGTGKMRRRIIQCPFTYIPLCKGICINGVLYYLAHHSDGSSYMIVCFDVRAEKFMFIDAECFPNPCGIMLINYKGKLGGIAWDGADNTLKLLMWVLEDVEKQEWSKYVYTLPENNIVYLPIAGVTATGEIVLSNFYTSKPFYVFYFNPERNTLLSVEIQGVLEGEQGFNNQRLFYGFVDHVEDLNFNFKTTYDINPPE